MKTYTTEQVWRLLKKHPTWTFEAPETDEWVSMKATFDGDENEPVIELYDGSMTYSAFDRSDWVRTNKPKPVLVAKVSNASRVVVFTMNDVLTRDAIGGENINPSKTYKVYLVECD